MSAPSSIFKWVWVPGVIVAIGIGFIAGRFTGGSVSDHSIDPNSSQPSRLSHFFGGSGSGDESSKTKSGGSVSHSLQQPVAGYTKDSFIEQTKSLNLFSGSGPKKLRKMLAIQESLVKQDVKELVEELIADGSPDARQAMYLAMGVLAEQSPAEALDIALAQPENMQQGAGLFQAVAASMEKDPEGTFARVRGIENKALQKRAVSSALNAVAMKDPAKALDLYLDQEISGPNDHSVHTIFYHWGRKDPAAAANSLERIPDLKKREQARNGLIREWMESDPAMAWEWAKTQPGADHSYNDPRIQALSSWVTRDPDAAMAAVQSLPENLRDETLPNMIGRWASKDPEAALNAAQSLPEDLQNKAMPQVISNWANTDPEAALAWVAANDDPGAMENAFRNLSHSDSIEPGRLYGLVLEKMPAGNAFRNTVSQVISRWAQKDPVAAAAALDQLPPGDAFNSSARNLIRQWSEKDPTAAFGWATRLPEGRGKSETISNWFSYVTDDYPDLAMNQFRQLNADQQNKYASNLASGLVKSDPAAAIRFSASLADGNIRKRAQESIARSWAYEDPQQAGRWAASLPEGEKSRAIRNVVDAWGNKNVEAAAEWLASMPASPSLDAATQSLSRRLVGVDPEAAMDWAGSIINEKTRSRALYDSAREWIRNDPANGKAWVQRSNQLTQKQKEKLLK